MMKIYIVIYITFYILSHIFSFMKCVTIQNSKVYEYVFSFIIDMYQYIVIHGPCIYCSILLWFSIINIWKYIMQYIDILLYMIYIILILYFPVYSYIFCFIMENIHSVKSVMFIKVHVHVKAGVPKLCSVDYLNCFWFFLHLMFEM